MELLFRKSGIDSLRVIFVLRLTLLNFNVQRVFLRHTGVVIFQLPFQSFGTSFPADIRASQNPDIFKSRLKTINSVSFIYSCKVHKRVMTSALFKSKHEETKAQTFVSHKRHPDDEVKYLFCFSLRMVRNFCFGARWDAITDAIGSERVKRLRYNFPVDVCGPRAPDFINRTPEGRGMRDQRDSSRHPLASPSKPPDSVNSVKVINCRVGHTGRFCRLLASNNRES